MDQVGSKKKSPMIWIQELKDELKKVSWTTKQELTTCTKIVVGSILLFGMGIYLIDLSIKGILELIKWIVSPLVS